MDSVELLDFWFGEKNKDSDLHEYRGSLWWNRIHPKIRNVNIDQYISEKWKNTLDMYESIDDIYTENHPLKSWMSDRDGYVALLILFDQFPRHIYRGTAKAFAFDKLALQIAQDICQDSDLPMAFAFFIYIVFIHSEDPTIVNQGVLGLLNLAYIYNDRDPKWRQGFKITIKSGKEHLKILKRFGRYPHRNDALGRQNTKAEDDFLKNEKRPKWMKNQAPSHTKLKILVLHSNKQSGAVFQKKTKFYLENKLNDIAELTYADAPQTYELPEDYQSTEISKNHIHARCWWIATDDPKTMIYRGLDESISYINTLFKNNRFDGIIGFSQGGTLAGIIASLLDDERLVDVAKSLKFVTIISGFYCRDIRYAHILEKIPTEHTPEHVKIKQNVIKIPSFHIWGKGDTLVDPWRSEKLSQAFENKTIHTHNSGHFIKAIKYWNITELHKWLEKFLEQTEKTPTPNIQNIIQMGENVLEFINTDEKLWKFLIDNDSGNPAYREFLSNLIATQLKREYQTYYVNKLPGKPSELISVAPRYNSFYKKTRLHHDVALKLASILNIFSSEEEIPHENTTRHTKLAYNQYRKVLSRLRNIKCPEKEVQDLEDPSETVSDYILHPRAEPVEISNVEMFKPLYDFLENEEAKKEDVIFPKGTICPDGRLDLCKQVIGPLGVDELIEALKKDSSQPTPKVKHLLLGNNLCGNALGKAIAKFISSGTSSLTTWYIAGNDIGAEGIEPICEALKNDKQVKQLWLKRNPLYLEGVQYIADMLKYNTYLKVLDVSNTGIMDEGAVMLLNNLSSSLEYLYLACNGLTYKTCETVSEIINTKSINLEQISLGCNRLDDKGSLHISLALRNPKCKLKSLEIASCGIGPLGAKYLSDALKINKSLIYLNCGFLKSTKDVGEIPNHIESEGAMEFAHMLEENVTLRWLDLVYTKIQQSGISALAQVLLNVNFTLIGLNVEQYGIPHNELSREIIRKSLQRNKDSLTDDDLSYIKNIVDPRHLEEIKSVYRIL